MKASLLNVHQFQFSSAGQMEKSHWEIIEKKGEILKSKVKNQELCFPSQFIPQTLINIF